MKKMDLKKLMITSLMMITAAFLPAKDAYAQEQKKDVFLNIYPDYDMDEYFINQNDPLMWQEERVVTVTTHNTYDAIYIEEEKVEELKRGVKETIKGLKEDGTLSDDMSDLEKYYTIARWMDNWKDYSKKHSDCYHSQTAWSALFEHCAVCNGWAQLYRDLCHEMGLACYTALVDGAPEQLHMMNYIPNINGKGMFIDVYNGDYIATRLPGNGSYSQFDKVYYSGPYCSMHITGQVSYTTFYKEFMHMQQYFDPDYKERGSGVPGYHLSRITDDADFMDHYDYFGFTDHNKKLFDITDIKTNRVVLAKNGYTKDQLSKFIDVTCDDGYKPVYGVDYTFDLVYVPREYWGSNINKGNMCTKIMKGEWKPFPVSELGDYFKKTGGRICIYTSALPTKNSRFKRGTAGYHAIELLTVSAEGNDASKSYTTYLGSMDASLAKDTYNYTECTGRYWDHSGQTDTIDGGCYEINNDIKIVTPEGDTLKLGTDIYVERVRFTYKEGYSEGKKHSSVLIKAKEGGKYNGSITIPFFVDTSIPAPTVKEQVYKNVTVIAGTTTADTDLARSEQDVEYQASNINPLIATVNSSGVIKGIKQGTATVKVTKKKVIYTVTVRVIDPAFSSAEYNLNKGENILHGFKADGYDITFTSLNESIATIDGNRIKAVKPGSTMVKALVRGRESTAMVRVFDPKIEGNDGMYVGNSRTYRIDNGYGTTKWSTSDKKIATITTKGVVKAVSAGTVTVTAINNGKTLTKEITVYSKPKFKKKTFNLNTGETLTDMFNDPGSSEVAYSSNKPYIAEVSADGKVTGVASGKAVITATVNGVKYKTAVNVYNPRVAGRKIVYLNKTKEFKIKGGRGKTVWSSSDPMVATVNSKGKVKGISEGAVTITAVNNGRTMDYNIEIHRTPKFGKKTCFLNAGETLTGIFDEAGIDTVYTVNKPSIAQIDENGKITGIKKGVVKVTAKADGKKYTMTLKVYDPVITGKTAVKVNKSVMLTVKKGRGKTVWSSSDPAIATVNSKGKVKGVSQGTVTITAVNNGRTMEYCMEVN